MYGFKECSSCGALYNKERCCSNVNFVDKFVRNPNKTPNSSQRPPHNCPKCGNPVEGLYCRQCALLRKKLEEVWFTICDKNEIFQDFLNTSKSSNDNTNVVNAPQEPFDFNQDPGKNSSQSPPHIDHHCCYGCGDSLDVLIISNSEPCYNQNVDEFPQTLPSLHLTCYSGDENSFTYDSNLNFVDDSPNPPLQPLTYSYELCGNDAHYGHYCPPQVPFIYNPEPGPHDTFQCQPMNQNSNSFGFDKFQRSQYPVIHHPPQETSVEMLQARENLMESIQTFLKKFNRISFRETPKVLLLAWEKFFEIKHACKEKQHQPEDIQELLNKLLHDVQIISEELANFINTPNWNRPAFYHDDDEDDDEEYTITITPILPTVEPDNSLSMRDENLSTIPEKEESNVEDLVSIPSESEDISDSMCDVPFCDNSTPLEALKDHSEILLDSNDDYSSSDDDSIYSEDIDYVEASPPDSELVSLEEVKDFENGDIDTDILLTIKDDILREKLLNINLLIAKIEALKDNPTPSSNFVTKSPSTSPNSFLEETNISYNCLPESETFCFNLEEKSSGYFDNLTRQPRVHVPNVLPTHPTIHLDSDFTLSSDSIGSDLVVSFPSETRNKIFIPGIFIEVQSKRFLSPNEFSISFIRDLLSPVFDTLLPFSSENEDNVFNPGILASNEEKSPHLLSHRGFKAFQLISDFSKSPMMIYGADIPILDVPFLHFYPFDKLKIAPDFEASRARGFVLRSLELQSSASLWESNIQILSTNVYL
ncbi:hypothetical protein Tco_1055637 [Tanacetum coccineum]|uniref:Uncharacterized protein n=1 Tax=Tanacetum coccineum TaxID=301880 RepID=A0ABQ5H0W8_9ASTR